MKPKSLIEKKMMNREYRIRHKKQYKAFIQEIKDYK